jgi:hypothetical protein
MMDDATEIDIQRSLREIFERLGGIDAKLAEGSKRHIEFSQQIAELDAKVAAVETLQTTIDKIQPIADNWRRATWVGTGIVLSFGAICGFLGLFWNEIRTAIAIAFGGKH